MDNYTKIAILGSSAYVIAFSTTFYNNNRNISTWSKLKDGVKCLSSKRKIAENFFEQFLQHEYLKLRSTDDIVDIEVCGSIKNVIASAAGILAGIGLHESTKAIFITKSLHDIKELIKILGGDKKQFCSLIDFEIFF